MIAPREPETATGRLFDRRMVGRLLRYARPYWKPAVLAVCILVIMAGSASYLPVIIRNAIDRYLTAGDLPDGERLGGLWRATALFFGLSTLSFAARYGEGMLVSYMGQRILYDIRAELFAKILRLPLRFVDRTAVGRLMTRLTSDVDAIQRFVTDGLVGLIADLFMLAGIIVFMVILSPLLAGVMLLMMPVLFIAIGTINRRIRDTQRAVRREQSALNGTLQEMITGMATIQLFHREASVREDFGGRSGTLRDAGVRAVNAFSLFFPTMEVLNAASFALVLALGGLALANDVGQVTLGVLVAFLIYVRDFFRPLEHLSDKSNILQSAMAAAERIFGLLDTPEEIEDPERPVSLGRIRGEIAFDRVWFAYEDEDWVLRDLDITIPPGQSVALVGATGAGKTSVISLISRFYDVQRGAVRVDGADVRHIRQRELRRSLGIVLQDPFIFSGTVADNIALWNPRLSREEIRDAAAYVNADGFIRALSNGYDTHLEERGTSLSTGQKQLLALARALVQDPDILLILDEATASVDTETEQLIQDALHKLMQNRTTIVIAHRLSTIRDVDRILVMKKGEVIEDGSHDDLVAANGHYRQLVDLLQAGTPQ